MKRNVAQVTIPTLSVISVVPWLSLGLACVACSLEPNYFVSGDDGGVSTDGDVDGDTDGDADVETDTAVATPCGDPNMIDDMEDGDGIICTTSGRIGLWIANNDTTEGGVQEPPPLTDFIMTQIEQARSNSRYAVHTYGSGFTNWGAYICAKVYSGEMNYPFDASAYAGVAFSARSATDTPIKVKVRTVGTLPEVAGGTCTEKCNDSYALPDIPVAADWSDYQITFAELAQEGWGPAVPFDKAAVMGIEFIVPPDDTNGYDLWIDDLRFF